MRKAVAMWDGVELSIDKIRKSLYGKDAKPDEYKLGYIINQSIEIFDNPSCLMDENIVAEEERLKKARVTKTINFRSSSWEKLVGLAAANSISEASACRRIIIYTAAQEKVSKDVPQFDVRKYRSSLIDIESRARAQQKILSEALRNAENIVRELEKIIDSIDCNNNEDATDEKKGDD